MIVRILACACLIGLGAAGMIASAGIQAGQTQTAKAPSAPKQGKENDTLEVSFASMRHNDATGEGEYTRFTAIDKETTVSGDLCKLHDKKKTAEATGNLKMSDPQADATGDKAIVYYAKSKKILNLVGNVQILVKPKDKNAKPDSQVGNTVGPAPVKVEGQKAVVEPKPESKSDDNEDSARKNPATITCDRFEYHYHKDVKHGILTGNFKVVQKLPKKTRTLTAEHGEWFGKEDKIILYPPVHFEDTEGTSFDPKGEVILYTKEGNESIEMNKGGSGKINVKDEDEEKPPAKKKT